MNQQRTNNNKNNDASGLRYVCILSLLIISALLLAGRLTYLFIADAERFPITTIKVAASYDHITHKDLENILAKHVGASFFALPVGRLQDEFSNLNWIDSAYVERVWPDTLKIKLVMKQFIF